jgi:aromatic-L-amino-acid decarboxylase
LEIDTANERLVARVNETGEIFLSHARIGGRVAIRIAIGHLRTTDAHVRRAWELLNSFA